MNKYEIFYNNIITYTYVFIKKGANKEDVDEMWEKEVNEESYPTRTSFVGSEDVPQSEGLRLGWLWQNSDFIPPTTY